MKIFISYRRKDSGREVGRIRDRLRSEFGEQNVFRDVVDIPAGVDFRTVLERETNDCKVMLVVIGPIWSGITDVQGNKRLFDPGDFTRIEVETGLSRLKDGVTVIPVLILDAMMPSPGDIPESLHPLTYQNAISIHDDPYFDFDMDRLIRTIKALKSYADLDISTKPYEPKTVYIAEGPFVMGSQPGKGIPEHETPEHEVILPAFRIGRFPVKNCEYEVFISKTKRQMQPNMYWDGQRVRSGFEDHPITGLTWLDALAYCQWLTEDTGKRYTLPNEAQWEKACRGGHDNLTYPWGDQFDPKRSNHGCEGLAPVNAYPPQNEFGCSDLVGNIRQWTCTLWGEKLIQPDPKYGYPWADDRRNDLNANRQIRRVIRGTSFREDSKFLRCSTRYGQTPNDAGWLGAGIGFRVAMNV
jgi:formylglycine-generating enzyme required for sulfatase activity